MRKWNKIITEIVGWLFILMAFLYMGDILLQIVNEQPAIAVGGTASVGILFAVMGFGFIFLNRIDEIKYNSRSPESDEYADQLMRQEVEKRQHNWIVIGIAIGIVLIILATLPLFI